MEASLDLSTYLFKLIIWFYKGRNYCLRQYLPFNAYGSVWTLERNPWLNLLAILHSLDFWKSWFSFFLPETVHVDKLPEEFQCCLGPGVYQRHIFEGHFTHFFEFANIFYGQSCPHLKSNQILWKKKGLGIQIFIFYCFLLMK